MKTWNIFWGLGFILAAVLIILDATDAIAPLTSFVGDISIFAIILGLLLFAYIISRLITGKIASVFFPLSFIFMLFEENIAKLANLENEDIISNWLVLLIALFLTIGFSFLIPHSEKSKGHRGNRGISVEITGNSAESSFGASSIYVDCASFSPAHVENSFGACTIHFENVENYRGGQTLHIENSFGSMCINVPSGWVVNSSIENNLGGCSKQTDATPNDCGPLLYIKGENNLGALSIRFV